MPGACKGFHTCAGAFFTNAKKPYKMSLTIIENDRGFDVKIQSVPWMLTAIKQIPGAYFRGTDKMWFVPVSSKAALLNWASNIGGQVQKMPDMGPVAPMPELTIDIPLKMKMYHYQAQGVAYNLQHERTIVADEPGLGKTIQAIAAVEAAGCKCILVICPNTLKGNWKAEIEQKWTNRKAMILTDRIKKTWPTFHKVGMINYVICNYESLKKYFVTAINVFHDEETGKKKPLRLNHIQFSELVSLFDAVIVDEAHKCKDGGTQQSKFVMGLAKNKKWRFLLTGTPVVNKPKDLIPLLVILQQLEQFGGYKGFVDRYCAGPNEASNLKHLNYMLNKICFFRRLKKDVLLDLPEKRRTIVKCEITTMDEYRKAEGNLAAYLKENVGKTDEQITITMRGEIMVLFGVLKKIAARGKVEQVIEYIREVNDAGEKMVVFAWHKDVIADLKAALPGAVTIVGDDSLETRENSVLQFQKCARCGIKKDYHDGQDHDHEPSSTKNILLNIKSGNVGLTLTASSRVASVELPWTAADRNQCEDRVHRNGQKDGVECIYFLGENTVDEDIYEIIEAKSAMAGQVMGDTDEVATEHSVVNELINRFKERLA